MTKVDDSFVAAINIPYSDLCAVIGIIAARIGEIKHDAPRTAARYDGINNRLVRQLELVEQDYKEIFDGDDEA